MSSKELDVEMIPTKRGYSTDQGETKAQRPVKRSNSVRKSKSATEEGQRESKADLKEAYERKKRMIPILVRWNNISFYLSTLGIVITLAEMEISRHVYNNDPLASFLPLVLKIVMTLSTILCCFALVRYWKSKVDIFRAKGLVHESATVWNTKKFRTSLLLELLVTSLHVPPYFDHIFGYIYGDLHFNVLGMIVFLRLYMVPRMMKQTFKKNFITHY